MLHKKSLPIGTLFMILVLLLATLGVGYGLWAAELTIVGTVYTGEVDLALSLEEIDEGEWFNAECPGSAGYSIGQDCDGVNGLNDDMEAEGKDIAECRAYFLDEDFSVLYVDVVNGYPSFNCFVRYNVENSGTIPVKVHSPVYSNPNPAAIHFNGWPPPCYENDIQLHRGEAAYCNLHIHVEQAAEENATYTVRINIFGHQWNEEPPG